MRIDYSKFDIVHQAMSGMSLSAQQLGLDPLLYELVKIRASQINGCTYCLDMHTKDAVALGEAHERLHLVAAWKEAPNFTDEERAALLWTEEITRLCKTGASEVVYREVREIFSEEALVRLTVAIVAINAWNRFAVAFRSDVGGYTSRFSALVTS